MSRRRVFLTDAIGTGELPLAKRDLDHLVSAARVASGDELVVVDPAGRHALVRVTSVSRGGICGEVVEWFEAEPEPTVVLLQGVSKGSRMDLVVEKTVELGVSAIIPVLTERVVVRLDDSGRARRAERWRRIAHEAAKQSQRAFVPTVETPVSLDEGLEIAATVDGLVVFWEDAETAPGLGEALGKIGIEASRRKGPGPRSIAVLVGPEGGLTPDEVERARAAGGVVASLGRTVLRTETAGIAAVALALYELGGLGGVSHDPC